MKLRYRKFPYPVLFRDSYDYKLGNFSFRLDVKDELDEKSLIVNCFLNEEEIQSRVDKGDFAFLVHIECPYTKYRKSFMQTEADFEILLSHGDLEGDVDINAMVVACDDIQSYSNANLVDVYQEQGITVGFTKGDIIAFDYTQTITVKNNKTDNENQNSPIRVVKDSTLTKMAIDVNAAYIVVRLPDKEYENYNVYGREHAYKDIIFSNIMVPALYAGVDTMLNWEEEQFEGSPWAGLLEDEMEKRNYSLEVLREERYKIFNFVQDVFDSPINRFFTALDELAIEEEA